MTTFTESMDVAIIEVHMSHIEVHCIECGTFATHSIGFRASAEESARNHDCADCLAMWSDRADGLAAMCRELVDHVGCVTPAVDDARALITALRSHIAAGVDAGMIEDVEAIEHCYDNAYHAIESEMDYI